MPSKYFQDYYPDNFAHCYGCGRLKPKAYRLKAIGRAKRVSATSGRRPIIRVVYPIICMAA